MSTPETAQAVVAFSAPVLPAEHWTSIELYRRNYAHYLPILRPGQRVESLLPNSEPAMGRWTRRFIRDWTYPRVVARQAKCYSDAERPPLHIFDHSYGHLQKAWSPTLIHCRDLNHFVLPSLTGLQLMRWKQRVQRLEKTELVVAISQHLAEEIMEFLAVPQERIRVVHDAIGLDLFRPGLLAEATERFPELAKRREDEFLIINVGTNLPRKNLDTVYCAVKLLVERGLSARLIRVGLNSFRDNEEQYIAEAGIADAVTQLGVLPPKDVSLLYHLCHVLSFASAYEGFGVPTVEAQASGLPVVLARSSCLPEIGGEGALYHETKDAEQLADLLAEVAAGSARVRATVVKGFENAKRFSWENHMTRLFELYAELR